MTDRETKGYAPCTHPAEARSRAMLADGDYCSACSSIVMDVGTVEPVRITGYKEYRR